MMVCEIDLHYLETQHQSQTHTGLLPRNTLPVASIFPGEIDISVRY